MPVTLIAEGDEPDIPAASDAEFDVVSIGRGDRSDMSFSKVIGRGDRGRDRGAGSVASLQLHCMAFAARCVRVIVPGERLDDAGRP